MKHLLTTSITTAAILSGMALSAQAAGPEITTQKLDENIYAMSFGYYTSLVVIGDDGVLLVDPATHIARPFCVKRLRA